MVVRMHVIWKEGNVGWGPLFFGGFSVGSRSPRAKAIWHHDKATLVRPEMLKDCIEELDRVGECGVRVEELRLGGPA